MVVSGATAQRTLQTPRSAQGPTISEDPPSGGVKAIESKDIDAALVQVMEEAKNQGKKSLWSVVARLKLNNERKAAIREQISAMDAGKYEYGDETAGAAIESLRTKEGEISGEDMAKTIFYATSDLDGQAAGAELDDLTKFVEANADRMSPEAKAAFAKYKKVADAYKAQGKTGIPMSAYNEMLKDIGFERPANPTPPPSAKEAQQSRLDAVAALEKELDSLVDVGDEIRTTVQLTMMNYDQVSKTSSNVSKKFDQTAGTQIGNIK